MSDGRVAVPSDVCGALCTYPVPNRRALCARLLAENQEVSSTGDLDTSSTRSVYLHFNALHCYSVACSGAPFLLATPPGRSQRRISILNCQGQGTEINEIKHVEQEDAASSSEPTQHCEQSTEEPVAIEPRWHQVTWISARSVLYVLLFLAKSTESSLGLLVSPGIRCAFHCFPQGEHNAQQEPL